MGYRGGGRSPVGNEVDKIPELGRRTLNLKTEVVEGEGSVGDLRSRELLKFASPCLGRVRVRVGWGADAISKKRGRDWGRMGDRRQCLEARTGQHVFQSSQHLVQSGKLGRVRARVGREGP
jgi:hypothetical protein